MKYFICSITEMINGFETTTKKLILAENENSAKEKLNETMKTWRGESSFEDNGYWFDGGGICVKGYVEKEIPAEHAVILAQYL